MIEETQSAVLWDAADAAAVEVDAGAALAPAAAPAPPSEMLVDDLMISTTAESESETAATAVVADAAPGEEGMADTATAETATAETATAETATAEVATAAASAIPPAIAPALEEPTTAVLDSEAAQLPVPPPEALDDESDDVEQAALEHQQGLAHPPAHPPADPQLHHAIGGAPGSATAGDFKLDSSKPWYRFGRGSVDKSGASGGPAWEPDSARTVCTSCRKRFDFFHRRSHCRMDGKIYCKACCRNFRLLPAHFGVREPQRVCDACAATLDPMQDELSATMSNATRTLDYAAKPRSPLSLAVSAPVSFSMSAELKKARSAVHSFFGVAIDAAAKADVDTDTQEGGAGAGAQTTEGADAGAGTAVGADAGEAGTSAGGGAGGAGGAGGVLRDGVLHDEYIPAMLLKDAKGIAFITVVKMGFIVTGRIGTGLVVARDRRQGSWTAPSAIGLLGVGWGAQIGGEVTDFIVILNTESAVDAFSGKGQVSLGSQLSVAAGPLGRTGEASVSVNNEAFAPVYTYSKSKGLFAGISLEGAVISERADVNDRFYGKHYDPKDILAGRVPRPNAAAPLYEALEIVCSTDPASFRASTSGVAASSALEI